MFSGHENMSSRSLQAFVRVSFAYVAYLSTKLNCERQTGSHGLANLLCSKNIVSRSLSQICIHLKNIHKFHREISDQTGTTFLNSKQNSEAKQKFWRFCEIIFPSLGRKFSRNLLDRILQLFMPKFGKENAWLVRTVPTRFINLYAGLGASFVTGLNDWHHLKAKLWPSNSLKN